MPRAKVRVGDSVKVLLCLWREIAAVCLSKCLVNRTSKFLL
jgi:hypothetical protein